MHWKTSLYCFPLDRKDRTNSHILNVYPELHKRILQMFLKCEFSMLPVELMFPCTGNGLKETRNQSNSCSGVWKFPIPVKKNSRVPLVYFSALTNFLMLCWFIIQKFHKIIGKLFLKILSSPGISYAWCFGFCKYSNKKKCFKNVIVWVYRLLTKSEVDLHFVTFL